jgi:hypothetical protein
MTYSYQSIGSVFVAVTEVIEDLLRLRFSKIAKALVEVRTNRIGLMKSEVGMKGAQVAYLVQARTRFSAE